tara:strand:+ start:646 stop:1023 length:378 start_codon:yes stop_codon:yes gene_type:complete
MAAPIGNKNSEKYTLEQELPIFQELLERTQAGEYLSIQEVVMKSKYSRQIFYYLCDRFVDLDTIRKEISESIIAVVSRGSLENKYNASASIWRMKQLGEKDQQYQDHTSKGEKMQDKTVIKFVRK